MRCDGSGVIPSKAPEIDQGLAEEFGNVLDVFATFVEHGPSEALVIAGDDDKAGFDPCGLEALRRLKQELDVLEQQDREEHAKKDRQRRRAAEMRKR